MKNLRLSAGVFFLSIILSANLAFAKKKNITSIPDRVQTSLVIDTKSRKILHSENPSVRIYPASLTKVMTLYMIFEAIQKGRLTLDKKLYVSTTAQNMRPSKLGLRAGELISVKDIISALIIKSANDAAVVAAEAIAGSESRFAKLMTLRARQLGMKHTVFKNASGWHHPEQKTTALDLAKLAIAIRRDHQRFYSLFSQTSFAYKGRMINGHNKVAANYQGAEGLKTGYTMPAGYNLITTASRKNKTLIGIVTGSPSSSNRDQKMIALLDKHFGTDKTPTIRNVAPNIKKITPVKAKRPRIVTAAVASKQQRKRIARS